MRTPALPEECEYWGADIIARAKEFAEVHGDAYVNKDFDELKKAIVADALPKNIAGLQRDLGKYRIKYDVWFHESDLHSSGAVRAVVDKLPSIGARCKAEDSAIMYRSVQHAAKYGVVSKRKTDDSGEEARTRCSSAPTQIPTMFAADVPTTTTSWPCAALTSHRRLGRRPPRPTLPQREGRDGRYQG